MAHSDYETSRDQGAPVELFLFRYGSDPAAVYAHTSATQEIVYDGVTYEPLPIERDTAVKSKGRPERADMKIGVPLSSPVADLFRTFPPNRVVSLVIRQGHLPTELTPGAFEVGDLWPVAWTGRVLEGNRGEAKAVLTCEASSASLKRPGLRRNYQWPCPLALYRQGFGQCNADKAAATVTVTVDSLTGNTITLQDGWMPQTDPDPETSETEDRYAPSDYIGGLVVWQTPTGPEERGILRSDGADTFTLTGPTRSLEALDDIELSLGCPHTLIGCATLHQNSVNYGGQPFIPTFNPLNKNNHS